jgi:hypothetical protein
MIKFYIGEVKEILDTKFNIRFNLPGIINNIDKYPPASLISNKTHEVLVGDQIFIIQPNDMLEEWFYVPVKHDDYIGIRYKDATVDITDGKSITCLVSGGAIDQKIFIDSSGIKLSGNVEMNDVLGCCFNTKPVCPFDGLPHGSNKVDTID